MGQTEQYSQAFCTSHSSSALKQLPVMKPRTLKEQEIRLPFFKKAEDAKLPLPESSCFVFYTKLADPVTCVHFIGLSWQ